MNDSVAMSNSLLPQQPAPVTPAMEQLTAQAIAPVIPELMTVLLELRRNADVELQPRFPHANGKPYPLGRCDLISRHVLGQLAALMQQQTPLPPSLQALRGFLGGGGEVRSVWGVLRGRYFQNAFQVGSLYIDVANDTVDPAKPPIEVLPWVESGMAEVEDFQHFAAIAGSYWGASVYANTVLPGLAPILPAITVLPGQLPRLQSACDYMIEKCRRSDFKLNDAWLQGGPQPPADVAAALLAATPEPLRPRQGGLEAALAACDVVRNTGWGRDDAWRDARVKEYLTINAY